MASNYADLVTALKSLTQGETPNTVTLPMAENEWNTRPEADSYGIVSMDLEADALAGDDRKMDIFCEGSVDLFSHAKDGSGWVGEITKTLEEYCGPCWSLNSHTYERDTGIFHWEWTFEVSG